LLELIYLKNKCTEIGLTYIYGIGRSAALEILEKTKIDGTKKVGDLNDDEVAAIRAIIQSDFKVEGALRSENQLNTKAADGYWLLPRFAPSQRPAGPWTENPNQFPYTKR
jgi:hypothetical protein